MLPFKMNSYFIQQGCIKLSKSDSKEFTVTKDLVTLNFDSPLLIVYYL